MFPTCPTTSSAPTSGIPTPPGVNEEMLVPALKSAPMVAVSKVFKSMSIRSPVTLEEAMVNDVIGTVVDRFAVVVGGMVQMAPTLHVVVPDTMGAPVSFSMVSCGFANVRVRPVKLPAGIFAAVVM